MKSLVEILEGGFYKSTGINQATKKTLAEQKFLDNIITKCVDAVKDYRQLTADELYSLIDNLTYHIKHSFIIHGNNIDIIISPVDNRPFHDSWAWKWYNYKDNSKSRDYIEHREDSDDIIDIIYTFCRSNNGKVTFEFTENLV